MSLFLGLDVGTSGTKAVVYDPQAKRVMGRGACTYGVDSSVRGQAEQDPAVWIQAVREATTQALQSVADPSSIKGMGVSGQQHGMVVLSSDGTVLRKAKLWCDVTCGPEAEELSAALGQALVPSFTAPKLLWLKRHEPETFAKVKLILLPHNYVNYWLTGRAVMEASDASGTGFLADDQVSWDWSAVDAVDPCLRTCLPNLQSPDEEAGRLLPEIAEQLGMEPGIVVAAGGGDNAMAALGVGAVEQGTLVLSLGTSGTLFGPCQHQVKDPSGAICPFADATGAWLPLVCTINCAGALDKVRSSYGLSHAEAAERAAQVEPGCGGVTFLPLLGGERTPNWPHASGAIVGLDAGRCLDAGVIYRAALEGVTFLLAQTASRLAGFGLTAKELCVVGGGARHSLWLRIIADTFQLPIRVPVQEESAALGGALQAAAVVAGQRVGQYIQCHGVPMSDAVLQPNPGTAASYREAMDRSVALGELLFAGGRRW